MLVLFLVLPRQTIPVPTPPPDPPMTYVDTGAATIDDAAINAKGEPCTKTEETYVGVGFMFFGLKVIDAPPHLPAYLAGIRVGDELDPIFLIQVGNMKVGTPVVITVKRNGRILSFTATPILICYH